MRNAIFSVIAALVAAISIQVSGCDRHHEERPGCETGVTLSDLIADGKYDSVHEYVTEENFPDWHVCGAVTKGHKLFHIDHDTTQPQVTALMKAEGFVPATIEQLLAFGKDFPEEQRRSPIAAIGSQWTSPLGFRYFPCLDSTVDNKRELRVCTDLQVTDVDGRTYDWPRHFRFLGFKE